MQQRCAHLVEEFIQSTLNLSSNVEMSYSFQEQTLLSLQINSTKVQLLVPDDEDALIMLQEPDWLCNDINSEIISQGLDMRQILTQILKSVLRHNLMLSRSFSQSGDWDGDWDSSSSNNSLGGLSHSLEIAQDGQAFCLSSTQYTALMDSVDEVAAVIGEGNVVVNQELGCIKLKLNMGELMEERICHEMGVLFAVPVLVTLSYRASERPTVHCDQPDNSDCFAVHIWLRDLISHYIEKLFDDPEFLLKKPNPPDLSKGVNYSIDLKKSSSSGNRPAAPPPATVATENVAVKTETESTQKSPKGENGSGTVKSLFSRVFGRKKKEIPVESHVIELSLEPKGKKPRKQGGDDLPSEEAIEAVCAMGFDAFSAYNALNDHSSVEDAVNAILSHPDQYSVSRPDALSVLSTLVSMGFPSGKSAHALLQSCFQFDDAVALCMGEPLDNKEDAVAQKLAEAAQALVETSTGNFFFNLLEYLGARLGNIGSYCVSCHAPHNCVNHHGVVCCEALCVFRWEDQNLGDKLISTHLCPFKDCGDKDLSASHAAHMGQSINEMSEQFGIAAETLLEMLGHNYLPLAAMKKFFEALKTCRAKRITNILNPPLAARFERRWAEMRKVTPDIEPEVAYHGTSEEVIKKIQQTGFLLSKLAANTGNRGYYGAGIYTSPNAQISMGYCRNGKKMLVCAVLMGRIYKCRGLEMGVELHDGYDTHQSPCGNEWVIYHEASILPCYVIEW